MNDKQMAEILRKEHSVKLTGASILFITRIISDKQLATEAAIEIAKEIGDAEMAIDLQQSAEACTAMGCLFFRFIEQAFGREWLDDYVNGDITLPEPTAPDGATIN